MPLRPFRTSPRTGLTPYDKFFLTSYPGSGGWDNETIYQPTNCGAWARGRSLVAACRHADR